MSNNPDDNGPNGPEEPSDVETEEHVEHTEHTEHTEVTETTEEEEFQELEEEEVEEALEAEGFVGRTKQKLGNIKEEYFTADTESDHWADRPAMGDINRRGVLTGIGAVAVGGYALAEATDEDGWAVDWTPGQEEQPPIGGGGPSGPAGNETDDGTPAAADVDISNPTNYAFETEQELIEETGFCYPQEADVYIGAIDAGEIESTFDEDSFNGEDPTGALSFEEVEMELDDITAHQEMYAVDVDRKQGNNGDYDLFVQLVGEEDGGMYVTRKGAAQLSGLEFEEVFEGYHECN